MKKKLESILLAVATVAGTCGAPAMAVFAEEGTETVAETEAVEDAEEEENADEADAEDADAEDADEEDDDEDDVSDEYTTASSEMNVLHSCSRSCLLFLALCGSSGGVVVYVCISLTVEVVEVHEGRCICIRHISIGIKQIVILCCNGS